MRATFYDVNMSEEPIYCFNGKECTYQNCIQFNKQLDTCNFKIIGLLGKPAPVAQPTEVNPLQSQPTAKPTLEKGKYVDIQGVIVDTPTIATGDRKDGTQWHRTNFTVNYDNSEYRVTLWDALAEAAMDGYKTGDLINFKGIKVDEYKGDLQFVSSKYTEIV